MKKLILDKKKDHDQSLKENVSALSKEKNKFLTKKTTES